MRTRVMERTMLLIANGLLPRSVLDSNDCASPVPRLDRRSCQGSSCATNFAKLTWMCIQWRIFVVEPHVVIRRSAIFACLVVRQ